MSSKCPILCHNDIGWVFWIGGVFMDNTIPVDDEILLLKELDKGMDDMENGRTTPHEESMKKRRQRYSEYVI